MNIFNSLGSNYDFRFVLKALFAKNKKEYKSGLIEFLEKKYEGKAILVYKGRQAIELALEILNLPEDTFVAINGFTCFAVYKAVVNEHYNTEILDLSNSFELNFSAETLQKSLKQNPKIKVVIIQNTLGYPCDIEKICKICKDNNLILIEDLAHCVGTIYANGKEAGTIGDFVVLSFSQDKIIDAVSGGALIIRNKRYLKNVIPSAVEESLASKHQLLDRLYPLFTFIIRKAYPFSIGKVLHFFLKSFNLLSKPMNESFYEKFDLPSWYASLITDAFANLKKNLDHRREIAYIYNSILDKKIASKIIAKNIQMSSNLRFPIFVDNRKSLIKYLKDEGIYISDIWYDSVDESLPNAKSVSNKIVNLPTHINISSDDAKLLANKINLWLRE